MDVSCVLWMCYGRGRPQTGVGPSPDPDDRMCDTRDVHMYMLTTCCEDVHTCTYACAYTCFQQDVVFQETISMCHVEEVEVEKTCKTKTRFYFYTYLQFWGYTVKVFSV